ncbi:hypothetical protein [Levilactobacillus fujinensis]|uniref:Uncharacterized protein n=1 Tax=Levilactobacillus fujinensis TaxID=2486024 RepID=A0ABW1TCT8_9LACO|nr:hypothetical protein [Levilactobacillus fujinensis]
MTFLIGNGKGVTAQASSQYSAQRSHSVRLVWRQRMGRHVLQAKRGARYSRHLGIRYSNNDVTPTVTWVTDAHEKLYAKDRGKSAIYYHVKSEDGTLGGWIWRGYLTPIKQSARVSPQSEPLKSIQTAIHRETSKGYASPVNAMAIPVMTLFPGTHFDQSLYRAADTYLSIDDGPDAMGYDPQTVTGRKSLAYLLRQSGVAPKTFVCIIFEAKDPTSRESLDTALTKAGYTTAKRASFKGWSIGGSVLPTDSDLEGSGPGTGMIFLVPRV